jgi:exosortase/archaeosortase family protein
MKKRTQQIGSGLATSIKAYYQYVISAALVILLVWVVYGHDLVILLSEALQNDALSYILLAPFLFGIILYMKRNVVKASLSIESHRRNRTKYIDILVGVILCLVAFLMYWYGSYTFYPLEYHILSLPIFIMGMTLVLFNMKVLRALFLPILFLAFLIPIPSDFLYSAAGTLANFTTQVSYDLLRAVKMPVALNTSYGAPTLVLSPSAGASAGFSVDLPCSGVYSLLAFAMFAAFLAFVISGPLYKKGLTFALGFFTFGILNILRVSSIISVAYWFGQTVAMTVYHPVAGLIFIFFGMLLVLIVSEKLFKLKVLPEPLVQPFCSECQANQRNLEDFCANCGRFFNRLKTKISPEFWAKIILLLIACSIVVLSINAPTFAIMQGPIGVGQNANYENATSIFPQIQNYKLSFLYRDTAYEKLAQQDAALWYAYMNQSLPTVFVDVGVSGSITNLHNWESCLITYETSQGKSPLVNVLDSRDIQLMQNASLIAQYLVFTYPTNNVTQVTLYWYEQAPFNTGVTVEQKYVRISLIILTNNATDEQKLENELLPIGQAITEYWEPIRNQSLISIGVPVQQAVLVFSIVVVAFTKTAQYSNDRRKRTSNKKIFNRFSTAKDRIVYRTVQKLTKEKKAIETKDIKEALKIRTGRPVKSKKLLEIMNHLEESGFIRRDITSVQNQPRMVWRIQYH